HGWSVSGAERDGGSRKRRDVIGKLVSHAIRERFSLGDAYAFIDRDDEVDRQLMTDPARLHVVDGTDASDMACGMARLVGDARVDAVEVARDDCARRLPDDAKDGDGDKQSDDRVGERVAHPDTKCAEDYGKAGQTVGS